MIRKFYFVRHGQNEHTKESHLTQLGMKQAAWAATQLPEGMPIFSSSITRAKETANIIAGVTGSGITIDERLRERFDMTDVPNLGFKQYQDLINKSNRDHDFELPNGQSVKKKGIEMYSLIKELCFNDEVILVSHSGAILDFMRFAYTKFEESDWQWFRTPYASVTVFGGSTDLDIINQLFCPYV